MPEGRRTSSSPFHQVSSESTELNRSFSMGIVSMVETPPYPIALRGKRFAVERAVVDVGGFAFRITVRTAKSPISKRKGELRGELYPAIRKVAQTTLPSGTGVQPQPSVNAPTTSRPRPSSRREPLGAPAAGG